MRIGVSTFSMFMLGSAFSLMPLSSNGATLKYSDYQPLGQMRTSFLDEVLFPAIEHESDGRLHIESHWNGELADSKQAIHKLSEGKTVDISTIIPEYAEEELPLAQIFKSFPVGPSGQQGGSIL
jgi:TRAP-type C4-dicarboxylate transport system substrate-binding protein